MKKNKLRLALLISGGGTTASAIISACLNGRLKIDPVLVIASSSGIAGINRVQEAGINANNIVIINPKACKDKDEFADKLILECKKKKVDLIGQYGWLPLTPAKFIKVYEGKIINQHPGPLDPPRVDFGGKGMYGRRVHCAVLYFRRVTNHDFWTEAVTHFVTPEFDKGRIIKKRRIEILPGDTVEDLQKKVLPIEHEVQIEALDDFVKEKVRIYHRKELLIKNNELNVLNQAKNVAAILYPYG